MKMVLLIDIKPSSAAAEWVLLTATRSKKYRAVFSGQQELHSRLCEDHRDASLQSSPTQ